MLGWTMSKLADMLPRTPWPVCLLPAPLSPPPHTHTSSACLSVFIYACVCVCVLLWWWAPSLSEHQTTQLSPETCQTQLGHLPHPALSVTPPQLLSHPLLRLPTSPPPPCSPDSGRKLWYRGVEKQRGTFPFLSASKAPRPSSLSHQPLLISIKRLCRVPSSARALQTRRNWYRRDRGGERAEICTTHPRRLLFPSFVAFEVQVQQKKTDSLSFLHRLS